VESPGYTQVKQVQEEEHMKGIVIKLFAAVIVALPMAAGADDEGDIKYRQAIMKGLSGHGGAIAQIAKGKVSHTAALKGHAHALLELTKLVPAAFKNQTTGKSRSKGEVWSDWSGFDGKAGDMERAALDVVKAADSGPEAVKKTLGPLFDSCKGCHKNYREKKK
jgi:cytochrome c556